MTPSEKYVSELCEKSFLPFWSFASPLGKKNKELCDVFVVCENTIIIISVKDIALSQHQDDSIIYERWVKKAIHDSVTQIYGAERYLATVDEVLLKNKKTIIKLPPKKSRIIHRIAIAFGSSEDFPLPTGNFGRGYVHVFDEKSTYTILSELDTITDFTSYLIDKEKFVTNNTILIPTEADFLAFYLQTGLKIDIPIGTVISGNSLWEEYIKTIEYLEWQEDSAVSYIWDFMIIQLYKIHITETSTKERRHELEEAIRTINLESRINRIALGKMLDEAIKNKVQARMLRPLKNSKHSYVFMPLTDKNWEEKEGELELRCMVARYENPSAEKIIGISIGSNSNKESCFDICTIVIPEMDNEFIEEVNKIKEELGYFKNPVASDNKTANFINK
jgi:hypothetical protein